PSRKEWQRCWLATSGATSTKRARLSSSPDSLATEPSATVLPLCSCPLSRRPKNNSVQTSRTFARCRSTKRCAAVLRRLDNVEPSAMVTIAFLTTRLTMVDFTRVISDGLSSRRGERDFYIGLWRTCCALSCVVMFTGAAVANDTSQLLAAKPNPAASKPKSQQDMMKMLDDYENNVSHGGGTTGAQPMSPQGMGR